LLRRGRSNLAVDFKVGIASAMKQNWLRNDDKGRSHPDRVLLRDFKLTQLEQQGEYNVKEIYDGGRCVVVFVFF